jgi:hypothetical protein
MACVDFGWEVGHKQNKALRAIYAYCLKSIVTGMVMVRGFGDVIFRGITWKEPVKKSGKFFKDINKVIAITTEGKDTS